MKKVYGFLMITSMLISGFVGLGQVSESAVLEINDIGAMVDADGNLFYNKSGQSAGFEAPINSNKYVIYASNLWVSAYDENGALRVAAPTYPESKYKDYSAGPIADVYDQFYDYEYDRVWKLDIDEINEHIAHYNDDGYVMIEAIENWPAHGLEDNGEARDLAPFVDVNQNNIYDPENGDYPFILGDECIYFIMNDQRSTHASGGAKLGIEIHGMLYGFNTGPGSFQNTVFVNYRIINRSARNYKDVYYGYWNDFDLGYGGDDYVGSDSVRKMFFVYNADNEDESVLGYGKNPPVVGVRVLNEKMTSFMTYTNDWSMEGNPEQALDYYNYSSARFKNGKYFMLGDTIDSVWVDSIHYYLYPSDPALPFPYVSEMSMNRTPGERRAVGGYGPVELKAGGSECIDLAYTYVRNPGDDHISNLVILRQLSGEVKKYYNNMGFGCKCLTSSIANEAEGSESVVKVYYANDRLYFSPELINGFKVEIYGVKGQLIEKFNFKGKQSVDFSNYADGVYVIKTLSDKQIINTRVLKY